MPKISRVPMGRKPIRRTTNFYIVLMIDDENRIVSKQYINSAWPYGLTDVTGDASAAVDLLAMGQPVKCVNSRSFCDAVRNLYANKTCTKSDG